MIEMGMEQKVQKLEKEIDELKTALFQFETKTANALGVISSDLAKETEKLIADNRQSYLNASVEVFNEIRDRDLQEMDEDTKQIRRLAIAAVILSGISIIYSLLTDF